MRIALIHLARRPGPRETEQWPGQNQATEELENLQTLAIARHMRDGGRFAPLLICGHGSSLAGMAAREALPMMEFGSSRNPLDMFRLWRWQKIYPNPAVLVIGQEGLALGRKLLNMRKKSGGRLTAAFFLRPPPDAVAKYLTGVGHCICGSVFVAEKLKAMLEKFHPDALLPVFSICAPGMDLENFNFPEPEFLPESGAHFVFGMAESLLPGTGALCVARAMGAIWQREDLPPWETRMFGSGPRFEEVLDEAKALGVASRLSLLSDQPLSGVSRLCHAWLAPGMSAEEMPSTLGTGFAAGLPVICSKSPLHRERLANAGHNAALRVAENNPQEMARAMIAIMRDRRLRVHMAKAGRIIARNIGLESMARRVGALVEEWEQPESEAREKDE